uniref:Uncharacterized protein n=1 Tax=Nymphaea colorata TaxID=210225 RepID=A0A5K1ARC3_9MAGN
MLVGSHAATRFVLAPSRFLHNAIA